MTQAEEHPHWRSHSDLHSYWQLFRMLAMASCSAGVTQRLYFDLTAACRSTYSHRNALFGGSHVAASLSPLALFAGPSAAIRFSGSFASSLR